MNGIALNPETISSGLFPVNPTGVSPINKLRMAGIRSPEF